VAVWDRYIGGVTGIEGEIWSGRRFVPRYMCHDPDVGTVTAIYATKPPVCQLILTPRVQFLGQAIDWDISESRSATSTISTFSIDWGGDTDVGDLSGELWVSDPLSGSVTYDDVGVYEVNAHVVDLLGTESQHCISTVEIVLPEERVYVGSIDLGVFVMVNGATPVASNTGLSGDQLKLRALRLHPAYADLTGDRQHVWIATKDGVSYSTDGAATWVNISKSDLGEPVNAVEDDPAPATADLDQLDICFDPQDQRRIYVVRFTVSPERVWLYVSDTYGESWENDQVGVV
jgi:hypothetical protein